MIAGVIHFFCQIGHNRLHNKFALALERRLEITGGIGRPGGWWGGRLRFATGGQSRREQETACHQAKVFKPDEYRIEWQLFHKDLIEFI
jgi:hypothetical protein